jgi:hypothetical protein
MIDDEGRMDRRSKMRAHGFLIALFFAAGVSGACASSSAIGSGGTGGLGVGGTGGAGGAADPCATALYCDDFESYPVGQAPGGAWTTELGSGTVSVDGGEHHSGTKSVKFTTQAGGGTKTAFMKLATSAVFPVTPNVFYGRMMFQLQAAPTASVHWTFIQGGGLVPGQSYHALYRYGGQLPVMQGTLFVGSQLMASYDTPDSYSGTGPSSDCYQHANQTVVPTGGWTCAEWMFDGVNDVLQLSLGGQPLDDLTVNGTGQGCVNQPAGYPWTAPIFDEVELGWQSYQTDDARTIWIDDVVISKFPIGCPPS